MFRLYIVIVALLLGGCGRVATELVMDPNLTSRQMEAIVLSAEYWCEQGQGCLDVSVGEDFGRGFVTRASNCPEMKAGYMDPVGLVLTLCDDRDHLLDRVAPHEVGHMLGLNHTNSDGIMHKYIEYQPVVINIEQ